LRFDLWGGRRWLGGVSVSRVSAEKHDVIESRSEDERNREGRGRHTDWTRLTDYVISSDWLKEGSLAHSMSSHTKASVHRSSRFPCTTQVSSALGTGPPARQKELRSSAPHANSPGTPSPPDFYLAPACSAYRRDFPSVTRHQLQPQQLNAERLLSRSGND